MKRSLSDDLQRKANEILKASVRYAFDHPKAGWDFIKSLAQSTSDEVIRQHIDLYVNSHSLDLGKDGRAAIIRLLMESKKAGLSTGFEGNLFIS
jgi:1,4-dihydroxy-6-naphthoate synthase